MELRKGWLGRQLDRINIDVATWPESMRRGYSDSDLTPQQRGAAIAILKARVAELEGQKGGDTQQVKSQLITGGSREQKLENILVVLLNLIEDDTLIYNPELDNYSLAQALELVDEAGVALQLDDTSGVDDEGEDG